MFILSTYILPINNLNPRRDYALGFVYWYMEQITKKKHKSRAGSSALSAQLQYAPRDLVRCLAIGLAPSFIHLITLSSICLISGSIRWDRSLVVGLCPLLLVSTLWVLSSSLGSVFHRWVLPSVIGFRPLLLGAAFHRWFYPSSSGAAFHRWVIHLVSELCLLPLGCTLSHWALLLWHLLCQHGGSSMSIPLLSNPPRGVVDRRYVSLMGATPHCWAVGGQ